jgi:hypothetical protein
MSPVTLMALIAYHMAPIRSCSETWGLTWAVSYSESLLIHWGETKLQHYHTAPVISYSETWGLTWVVSYFESLLIHWGETKLQHYQSVCSVHFSFIHAVKVSVQKIHSFFVIVITELVVHYMKCHNCRHMIWYILRWEVGQPASKWTCV